MRFGSVLALVCAAFLLGSSPAAAQGTWSLTFPANPDHSTVAQGANVVQKYELVATPQGGAALAAVDLGKPAPVAGVITYDINSYILTLAPGTYTAVVRAVGPGGQAVSPASSPFQLVVPAPGPQGAPGISKSSTARVSK